MVAGGRHAHDELPGRRLDEVVVLTAARRPDEDRLPCCEVIARQPGQDLHAAEGRDIQPAADPHQAQRSAKPRGDSNRAGAGARHDVEAVGRMRVRPRRRDPQATVGRRTRTRTSVSNRSRRSSRAGLPGRAVRRRSRQGPARRSWYVRSCRSSHIRSAVRRPTARRRVAQRAAPVAPTRTSPEPSQDRRAGSSQRAATRS